MMRASKTKHLRSENSEDVVSWNVFRTLRQMSPIAWLPLLADRAFPGGQFKTQTSTQVSIELWKPVAPPPALLLNGDEGISEIDISLESPSWVWFIEAKYTSDISEGTTTRPDRDQVLRNIDVGSYYAGVREFFFALLILDKARSPKGVSAIERYQQDFGEIRRRLPHRPDALSNLRGVALLSWMDVAEVLLAAASRVTKRDEACFAQRAVEWLHSRGIGA
jgi:hypothetical protein